MVEKKTWSVKLFFPDDHQVMNDALNLASEHTVIKEKGEALLLIAKHYTDFINPTVTSETLIPDEIITPEQLKRDKALKAICERRLLTIINGVPYCGQSTFPKGIGAMKPFIYTEKTLPNHGQIMSLSDIERTCDMCKQSYAESGRLKDLVDAMTKELSEDRTANLYFCNHPDIINEMFTAFPLAKFFCAITGKNVTIANSCLKNECPYIEIEEIRFPPRNIEDT